MYFQQLVRNSFGVEKKKKKNWKQTSFHKQQQQSSPAVSSDPLDTRVYHCVWDQQHHCQLHLPCNGNVLLAWRLSQRMTISSTSRWCKNIWTNLKILPPLAGSLEWLISLQLRLSYVKLKTLESWPQWTYGNLIRRLSTPEHFEDQCLLNKKFMNLRRHGMQLFTLKCYYSAYSTQQKSAVLSYSRST